MKESIWGYAILVLGIAAVGIIWFFANTTRTDQHNYNLLKETTEAAMFDALDLATYRQDGTVRIEEEKFVENFIRRFAENADLSNTYKIEIYDVNEVPPKVSLRVSSVKETNATSSLPNGEIVEFDIVNNIDAILETKYFEKLSKENYITKLSFISCDENYEIISKSIMNVVPSTAINPKISSVSQILLGHASNARYKYIENLEVQIDNSDVKITGKCKAAGVVFVKYTIEYLEKEG